VAPVRPSVRRHREKTDFVAHQLVRHRLYRAARAVALVLAAGCAVFFTTFLGGVALAEPAPPSPSPSSTPEPSVSPTEPSPQGKVLSFSIGKLALTPTQGASGTSLTAAATGLRYCATISFEWDGQVDLGTAKIENEDTGNASLTSTVPDAVSGTHKVTASCTVGYAEATFTVTEKPSLTLSPEQGTPGRTRVTATTKGFDACLGGGLSVSQTMSWQWDGGPLQTSTAGGDRSTVTFEVPADASPSDEHRVTATCGDASAKAPFTVTPIAKPALTLDKGQGPRGSQLTAYGTGFACGDDRVQLLWDGNTSLADSPSGTFTAQLTIPADASISQHTVVASCRNHADISDSQSFTVTKDTVGGTAPAALALEPARGAPGDAVRVTGDRFACTNSRIVELSWDGQPLANPSADASGHFDTSISVPANAEAGNHTVRASCSAGSAVATAGFTVVVTGTIPTTNPKTISPPPPPPPPPPPGIAGWVLLLIVGVLAVLAYRHWRKPRNKPKPNPRVSATVSPTGGLPLVTTRETPAHGEVTHALRLQAHADLGTQTISEVDSDCATQ
jgi:hypothetical protein